MRPSRVVEALLLLSMFATVQAVGEEGPRRRAKPPQWSQEVRDVFFEDAREQLVGARPVVGVAKPQVVGVRVNSDASSWSQWIQAETLEAEIKRVASGLAGATSSSGKFSSGGYQQCQRDFSLLAVLFRVVEEFDEQTRWQKNAGAVRRYLEQAATLCEEANDPSYSAAKQVQGLLTDLLRGQSSLEGPAPKNFALENRQQVDRPALMLRMEQSVEEVLGLSLSNKKIFRRNVSKIAHESQLLAMLAKVIVEEGYESADDEEFLAYARQLGEASTALARASEEKNYEAARSAEGRLTQSCSGCHEDFRG